MESTEPRVRGRLAPSPTGALHLGNARSFLLAWLSVQLPHAVLMQTLAACLLHECAHLLAMRLVHQKPQSLRVSAASSILLVTSSSILVGLAPG